LVGSEWYGFTPMKLRLVGQFSLVDAQGVDRTPRAAKSRAVLAMLAQAADHRRSRRWLEAKLWSDRGPEQASGSLRQALVEIRRALGDQGHRVGSDREAIWLRGIDLDLKADRQAHLAGREFLEGIDIGDPEFEHWLAVERSLRGAVSSGAVLLPDRLAPDRLVPDRLVPDRLVPDRLMPDRLVPARPAAPHALTMRIAMAPAQAQADQFIGHSLANAVAGLIGEFAEVDIYAPTSAPTRIAVPDRGFCLSVDTLPGSGCIHVMVALSDGMSGRVQWSRRVLLKGSATDILAGRDFPQIVFEAADAAYGAIAAFPLRRPDQVRADGLTASAVRAMFSFDSNRLREADLALAQAIDIQPSGRSYAWRAYLRQIMAVERTETNWDQMAAEADEYSCKAMELAGQNALVCALASQIRVMIDGDAEIGLLLAQEAVAASPFNAFGHAALSGAHLRAGRYELALEAARLGAEIAGRSSFAPWWQALAGLAAMALGRYDEATAHYQAAHARSPGFRAPMRHLYVLYQAFGNTDKALRMLALLRRIEPDFSLIRVRDDLTYPAATLRRSDLISKAARYI